MSDYGLPITKKCIVTGTAARGTSYETAYLTDEDGYRHELAQYGHGLTNGDVVYLTYNRDAPQRSKSDE